jgi:predicted RNase H-like HicB family nuclease
MKHYHINIFWSEEDGAYVADIPDLEYCSALGDTPEKALSELATAKELWLQVATERGIPIPKPIYRPVIYQVAR